MGKKNNDYRQETTRQLKENAGQLKIVLIEWIDSESNNEWQPIEDLSTKLERSYACGFLIQDEKEFMRLTTSIDISTDSCIGTLLIPKKCILGFKTLTTFSRDDVDGNFQILKDFQGRWKTSVPSIEEA